MSFECLYTEIIDKEMGKMNYIIKDWAGKILDYKGRFELPEFAVSMNFESEVDAFEYIEENLREFLEDLHVEENIK